MYAGSVLATVRPGQPVQSFQHFTAPASRDDDESTFRLPANTNPRVQRVAGFLHKDLHIPESLVALVLKVCAEHAPSWLTVHNLRETRYFAVSACDACF